MNSQETIVVDGSNERQTSSAWIGVLIALVVLAVLFFIFGGYKLPGTSNQTTTTTPTQTTTQSTQSSSTPQ